MSRADGPDWLRATIDVRLLEADTTVEDLVALKERSKRHMADRIDATTRLAGLAGYYLAIAAGLRHHGQLIGGRSREEVDEVLVDLAEVASDPLQAFLEEAVAAPER